MVLTRQSAIGALLSLVVLALIALLLVSRQDTPKALQNATLLPEARALGPFSLIDDQGAALNRDSLRGKWTLMFFGFTHCPDVCPLTLQQLSSARSALLENGNKPLPDILLVSVDPERDTQEALAAYVAHFGDGVSGARGELPALQQLTKDVGIFFQREPGESDYYQVSHSAAVLLIDPEVRLHAVLSAPQQLAALVNDLPLLMSK